MKKASAPQPDLFHPATSTQVHNDRFTAIQHQKELLAACRAKDRSDGFKTGYADAIKHKPRRSFSVRGEAEFNHGYQEGYTKGENGLAVKL